MTKHDIPYAEPSAFTNTEAIEYKPKEKTGVASQNTSSSSTTSAKITEQKFTEARRDNDNNSQLPFSKFVTNIFGSITDPASLPSDWLLKGNLLRVKGQGSNVAVKQLPCRLDSFNHGDVFLLDTYLKVYIWIGSKSSAIEQEKARQFAKDISESRANIPVIEIKDSETTKLTQTERLFWSKIRNHRAIRLPCFGKVLIRSYNIQPASSSRIKDDFSVRQTRRCMFRIHLDDFAKNRSAQLGEFINFRCVAYGTKKKNLLPKSALKSSDVYIVDDGWRIWVWFGKDSKQQEADSVRYARKYVKKRKRPLSLPVKRLKEGEEAEDFWQSFGTHDYSGMSCLDMLSCLC